MPWPCPSLPSAHISGRYASPRILEARDCTSCPDPAPSPGMIFAEKSGSMWQTPMLYRHAYQQANCIDDDTLRLLSKKGEVQFMWNGRPCTGSYLHQVVLSANIEELTRILDEDPKSITCRFGYETQFHGQAQEGSGEPIHLAASRGHVEVVQVLVSRRAQLDTTVTRNHKPHYDVLHAAVFAEGRGGTEDMIRYLLEAKAPISPNADGDWPLHKAFQTGSVDLIRLLENDNVDQGPHATSPRPSPLEVGIRMGKMTEAQLAVAAPPTPDSLRVFIQHEQRCIPAFLQRLQDDHGWTAAELATHVDGLDIARVLNEAPEAAASLLDAMTTQPECESSGWWPLPTRVSFGPRTFLEQLRYRVNPIPNLLHFYEAETVWRYDVTSFEAPPWHKLLSDRNWGRPVVDAEVKVCFVPNLVCAEFFAALAEAEDDTIFKNVAVRGSIAEAWWNGSCRVDLVHVLFTLTGLSMLILESYLISQGDDGLSVGRQMASDFIGAKGVCDFMQELLQLAGFISIGRGRDYFQLENAGDLIACGLQVSFLIDRSNRILTVLVIFIYWIRLGSTFMWAENVARALIPIQRLVASLGPASLVTLVSFCAFTHAFYTVRGEGSNFVHDIIPMSFQTLIIGELSSKHKQLNGNTDMLELLLTYTAVIVFSIFMLNTFIGVIGEQYEVEKERCPLTFQRRRAAACFDFLLRCRVLPCALAEAKRANIAIACVVSIVLIAVTVSLTLGKYGIWTRPMFILCQLIVCFLAYQNPAAPWTACAGSSQSMKPHFLWLALPRDHTPLSTLDEIKSMVKNLLKSSEKNEPSRKTSSIKSSCCSTKSILEQFASNV